ncbi:MAG: aspartate--tRNA ligase [Psychroflexus sp.]|uniref:aspartate--tRNA ligase n=1 Tax=Psychroflexus sp. S27 TaxID=1982757 RepID=UPI000C2A1006|nr:aspartate--tRNA ligase [Psychroflexus sp. S27]PJX20172.1 aspartate--tRNA ligase [Psychroflexus sp. S27]
MYRTHNNNTLNLKNLGEKVKLSGWAQTIRDKGFIIWIDIRDRYGMTQLVFDAERTPEAVVKKAREIGREFVIQIEGEVIERESKNKNIPTGEIEILVEDLQILNSSKTPPFTIEDETDGGEDLRMKYRYLDLRRSPVKNKLLFRSKVSMAIRNYLSQKDFVDVETPYLIKSTPEGARDFVVPSRMNEGQFYALPQSPQTFKQLLMVGGLDKYFQIVKCFRDEDLRADRQPEFTQIDCEMSFVDQEEILDTFEGLTKHLLKEINGVEIEKFPRMTYADAMCKYGNDKPDIRFGMEFGELNEVTQHKEFKVFNEAELVVGIAIPGGASYSRKEIDKLIDWIRRPQVGAKGMVYVKCNDDGSFKSSVDKFYDQDDLKAWAEKTGAKPGDLIAVLSGNKNETRAQLSALRMEMATRLGLRKADEFAPLWIVDFPLLEWDEDSKRFHAMHHPFTSPKTEDIDKLKSNPGEVRANAYDLVLNGNEIGGGSIRIHDKETQSKMFDYLGFSEEEARAQFGFLMDAFEYGAPPHGGIAFGLDRLVAILGGQESIRDFIAFPKNNSGRDIMIDAPAQLSTDQLKELNIEVKLSLD